LESLFSLKVLIHQKSKTQNVKEWKGGQQKPWSTVKPREKSSEEGLKN